MKVGIVGNGVVGSAMVRFFSQSSRVGVCIYDKYQEAHRSQANRASVNQCDIVFVCVPTPTATDGMTCDLTAVQECIEWTTSPVCIRSTVIPGTASRLATQTRKIIGFSPEYIGEQPNHPWRNETDCGFLIVGGPSVVCDRVVAAYHAVGVPDLEIIRTDSTTAELCKYMENCFLATKVAFVNQFYDIAGAVGVDFEELRQLWITDPRIGLSHTTVSRERGFRGKCLPKDLAALAAMMQGRGGAKLLEAVLDYNRDLCATADAEASGRMTVSVRRSPVLGVGDQWKTGLR